MSVLQAARRGRTKSDESRSARAVARQAAVHVLLFIAGGLIARGAALGRLSPFGASFVAAIPFSYLPAGMLGTALSYLFFSPLSSFRYIAAMVIIGAIRWVLQDIKKISGSRFFPSAVAFLPIFGTGLALVFSAQSELSEVYECVIEAVIAAAGAFFMSRSAMLFESRRAISCFDQQELSCLAMTGCILLLSMSALIIGEVSVGRILAVLLTLLFARYGFVKGGSTAGIATGAVFALADKSWLFLSAGYSLGGLIGGLLAPMGKAAVIISVLICNTLFAFAAPDRSMLLSVALETAVASGVFLLIPKEAGNFLFAVFGDNTSRPSEEAVRRGVVMRLSHCSRALENVSSCVTAVSDRLGRLYEPNADRIYDRAAEYACRDCGLRVYCHEKEKDLTEEDFRRLTPILKEKGRVSADDITGNFMKRCCKTGELAHSVNRSYREYLSLEAARRRIAHVRSAVAGQFAGLSEILHDLSEEFELADGYDEACAGRVIEALSSAGIRVADCSCRLSSVGGMTVELELVAGRKTAFSRAQLAQEVSRACGRYFEQPALSFEGDRARAVLSELPLYDLEIGSSQHVCDDGELCGDCLNYFSSGKGELVAMISDGMGSGGRAAVDANMAVSIMTKLCKAGLSYDCSLAVTNSSLMIKSEDESLATMDVCEFNCFTGKASLMKAGACATFVRRNNKLIRKDMPSMPLGILNEARFVKEDVTLSRGDLIIMVSDGVAVGSPDWIERLISGSGKGSAEELAARIVDEAVKLRKGGHDDDITAIAMRVRETV